MEAAVARPNPELVLSDDERQTLNARANRPRSTQRPALCARIVLARAASILQPCGFFDGTPPARPEFD
jgi:hypothetical protein